jgi:hypothetical protein
MSDPTPLALNAQAALGPVRQPQRSQFSLLVRHFLERFFNHETASPDGDAKTRLVQIAVATGLPGFMIAIYLVAHLSPHRRLASRPTRNRRPATLLAPGQSSLLLCPLFLRRHGHRHRLRVGYVLSRPARSLGLEDSTHCRAARLSGARHGHRLFIAGFLFDVNIFAALVLPAAIDPPSLPRFLAAHLLAVAGSGLFAAAFILAMQGSASLPSRRAAVSQTLPPPAESCYHCPATAPLPLSGLLRRGARTAQVRQRLCALLSSLLVSRHLSAPSWKAPPPCPSTPLSPASAAPLCFSSPR